MVLAISGQFVKDEKKKNGDIQLHRFLKTSLLRSCKLLLVSWTCLLLAVAPLRTLENWSEEVINLIIMIMKIT